MKCKYGEEHIDFLRKNVKNMSLKELTDRFNKRFGCEVSEASIKYLKNRWKLKSGIDTRFGKRFEDGTERMDGKGYIRIKLEGKWLIKERYVYEEVYGKIPQGYVVMFKDGDRRNFDLDNLVLMSKKEMTIMNTKGLYKKNKELTETGILIAKMIEKMNGRRREMK